MQRVIILALLASSALFSQYPHPKVFFTDESRCWGVEPYKTMDVIEVGDRFRRISGIVEFCDRTGKVIDEIKGYYGILRQYQYRVVARCGNDIAQAVVSERVLVTTESHAGFFSTEVIERRHGVREDGLFTDTIALLVKQDAKTFLPSDFRRVFEQTLYVNAKRAVANRIEIRWKEGVIKVEPMLYKIFSE